jgi:hypothetical protein
VRTIKETIYECHIGTKKLNYWFAYEQLEGANESFTEYSFPTVRDRSIHYDKDETDALSINGTAYLHPTGFLFVHRFTKFYHLTLKKNGGIRLLWDRGVNMITSRELGHTHFLSKRAGLIPE